MAYTPELSLSGSATLRRLAWFLGKPMSKTLEQLIEETARHTAQISPGAICRACRDDSKCSICGFSPSGTSTQDGETKEVMEPPAGRTAQR
jgi:recombinational DNA repair protein RecR